MNKAIGGYFSLELPLYEEYHKRAIKLNTGRNCLEYILRYRQCKKIYIPFYTCNSILEPILKLGVDYEFYHINRHFELEKNIELRKDEVLLYTNYYGLKQDYVKFLVQHYGEKLIIDNTQAFFAIPLTGTDTFYSCRKFFGVPDGAYLYTNGHVDIQLEQDFSYNRMNHLINSIDHSQEYAFNAFHNSEESLKNQDTKKMSKLTQRIMQSIDYEEIARKRKDNFLYLHKELNDSNLLNFYISKDTTPLIYPYFSEDEKLREHLISNKIYVAQYWPNVLKWTDKDSIEYSLAVKMIPLPIDQRYSKEDMNYIIKTINR